jgi:deoxyribonuclease-4
MIGEEGFAALLQDKRILHVPRILETPKGEDLAEDKENLATLRRLAAS